MKTKLKNFLYNSFNDPTRSAKIKKFLQKKVIIIIIKSETIESTLNMKNFAANKQSISALNIVLTSVCFGKLHRKQL